LAAVGESFVTQQLKIIFAGTPDFSVAPLQALLESKHQVIAVYTQPDRPAGRGRALKPSPVKAAALEAGITVFQPKNFRDEADLQVLEALQADVMIVVAYGLILPQRVLDAPRYGCLNIHASLLPRWRGAAPIQRAIQAGDAQTGVTIMQMEAGLDTGPMLNIESIDIGPEETGGQLHDRLAPLGAKALMKTLDMLLADQLNPQVQDDALANYAHKLEKSEAEIDWSQSAIELERMVRAFNPWPVAYTRLGDKTLRIWQVQVPDLPQSGAAGSVLATSSEGIDVATGAGVLRISQLQPQGKRVMSARDFLNAHDLAGVSFG
jgi:methionyl-tRNA formyltransferase